MRDARSRGARALLALAVLSSAVAPPACRGGGTDAAVGADGGDGGPAADAAPPDGAASPDAGAPLWSCRVTAVPGAPFGAPLLVSDPARGSHVPALVARGARLLLAWHEFDASNVAHVVYTLVQEGCVGPIVPLAEPFAPSRRPALAATTTGWVLAYEANDGTNDVIRAVELDPTGNVLSGPDTISAPGAPGAVADVAAAGSDEAFAWTDGSAHYYSIRGPRETVAAMPVGTTLVSGGILNWPRIALDSAGTLHLAYRDGPTPSEWDVFLVVRPPEGAFGAPANVSLTPGFGSDSQDVFVEPDGTLDIVFAEEDPIDVFYYEATWVTRSTAGVLSAPAAYGAQGVQVWSPSVGPGLAAVWNTGSASGGALFFAAGPAPATLVFPGTSGRNAVLSIDADGGRHVAFVSEGLPAQVLYGWGL